MAFTARIVATSAAGNTVAILDTRLLRAKTLRQAKIETSRRQLVLKHLAASVLEIVDDTGAVVTRRMSTLKPLQTPWS